MSPFRPSGEGVAGGSVTVGLVTDNEDPEEMGRVKVTFPRWETDDESRWARIATTMAGPDRGTYFLPEVDDEVLVAFADADREHPYVLGGLWNGQDSPPASNDGNNDVRTIRSRSGHELEFDDGDSDGKVTLTSASGHEVVLDDASGSEKITITDKNGQNSVEFDATKGQLDITGGTKLTVEAPTVEISADGNLKLSSSGVLSIEGTLVTIN